ncbi:hypothetical protein HGI15_05405 [Modestobacter lapidis]|nr:hypothetical protein [Modestobacter lapidis]
MTGSFARGVLAGAAGTVALNVVTYLDMAVRGRPASTVPARTVDALADALGRPVPGSGAEREARRTALGALAGIAQGLAVGVLASTARSAGLRLPGAVGALAAGAASMAATDGPVAALGVSDPRDWSAADRTADAVPHLAYGAAVQAVLAAVPTPAERSRPRRPAGAGLTARAALLGVATGGRSAVGLGAPALTTAGTARRRQVAAVAALAGELVTDKLPGTPPRTGRGALGARMVSAAGGAGQLAGREGANAALPVLAGVAGSAAGSFGGIAWRRWASTRVPDWQAAVAEDLVAVTLGLLACRPVRSRRPRPALTVVPG